MGREIRVPSDVVVAIFAFIGARKRFPYNREKIDTALYKLSQENEFADLFNNFSFAQNYIWSFPYCEEIGYALDGLFFSGLLECIGPYMQECEVTENLAKKDFSDIFTQEETDLLRRVSEKFQKYVEEV